MSNNDAINNDTNVGNEDDVDDNTSGDSSANNMPKNSIFGQLSEFWLLRHIFYQNIRNAHPNSKISMPIDRYFGNGIRTLNSTYTL